ncbi:MAG: glycerol-3-phosphate 1-O-acyltransferase PlsY [Chloroflexi bacterium]|nr:glycerol-3-phosphate 1-O-acyltransferase PlsY [Chloroflexota bacterium]
MEIALIIVIAYLIGSIPTAYILVRVFYGIDIRRHGTGNVGASNVLKSASKKLGALVMPLDILKGVLAMVIARLFDADVAVQMVAGIAAIIGHNWPVFLKFQGGRGIATSLGVILALSPWLGLIMLVMAYSLAPLRQLSLGVFIGLTSLPILCWLLGDALGIEEKGVVTVGFIALTLLAYFRRLVLPRSALGQSISTGELFLNRLLFDRDIRNRKVWLEQNNET